MTPSLDFRNSLGVGIHDTVTPEIYHGPNVCDEPALSASIAKILLTRSPLHAWTAHSKLNPNYEPTYSDKFDIGTAAHSLLLEGDKFAEKVATVDEANWATKVAKEHRAACRVSGHVPLLMKDWQRVVEMVEAVRDQIAARDDDVPLFSEGKPEMTLLWRDPATDVQCKARLDWLRDDFLAVDDFKSVPTVGGSSNPHDWSRRTFWSIGADVEARFHTRGVKALTGVEPHFRFVVAEAFKPFAISVLDLAPSAIELADQKIDTALALWKRCMDSGVWPGYGDQIASVETTWQEADHLMRHWDGTEAAA